MDCRSQDDSTQSRIAGTTSASEELFRIQRAIRVVRGLKVMIDEDLAGFYGVTTRRLNEQFRRNRDRFPEDFVFQMTVGEMASLRSQSAISNGRGGRRHLPFAFTEHGAIMLATVLNSPVAVAASVRIVRAFVRMREMAAVQSKLSMELDKLRDRVDIHDCSINAIMEVINQLLQPPAETKRPIGFRTK
jgi:hypothetical protein